MENMGAQSSDAFSGFSSHSKKLAMHKDSHTISKLKPKIRIIHIVAPEIINTDVENFRDLVQRLTGKSAEVKGRTKKLHKLLPPKGISSTICPKLWTNNIQLQEDQGIQILQDAQIMKKEMECINEGESSHGNFVGFGYMDINFIEDLTQFPMLPFKSSQLQINNIFGDMPLC